MDSFSKGYIQLNLQLGRTCAATFQIKKLNILRKQKFLKKLNSFLLLYLSLSTS